MRRRGSSGAGTASRRSSPSRTPARATPEAGGCYETEQVFLEWKGGAWTIATSGTGISCGSGETAATVVRVCRGLGYPDLTTARFQMPSKNIGCIAGGGYIRCDILSGMKPEPSRSCPYDWVGITMDANGPAAPQCAGDTVYDGTAPTLAYGGTWKRGAFSCESSETGLRCANRAGGAFTLAREGWTAG